MSAVHRTTRAPLPGEIDAAMAAAHIEALEARLSAAEAVAARLSREMEESEARHRYCHEHGECASFAAAAPPDEVLP